MERYELKNLYTREEFSSAIHDLFEDGAYADGSLIMGLSLSEIEPVIWFVASAIYCYFFNDLVAYAGDSEDEVRDTFQDRLTYDIAVKLPYWYRKYKYIKKLLTDEDMSLLQTSKVVSSSQDNTASASGSLQKIATTPTGVSTGGVIDNIDITNTIDSNKDSTAEVETDTFADKYSNTQQKFASANNVKGERSGTITREGSIDELLNVLEKLPSSFANEVTKAVGKHFIFDYDGEERGYYDETN